MTARSPALSPYPGIALLGLVWLALGWADFPRPQVDDAFFTGTAINLARHGGLHNPWLGRWMHNFGTDFFWVQPPFHPWLFGAWLRIFKISPAAVLGFQCSAGFVATSAILTLLRRAGLGWAKSAGVILVVTLLLLGRGFRPDAAGIACAALAGVCWRRPGLVPWFIGCVLGAAAPLIHPFALTLVVPLGLGSFFWPPLGSAPEAPLPAGWVRLALAAAAGAGVFLLFLLSIDFQLAGFCHTFLQHARMRTPGSGHRLAALWEQARLGWEPILRGPTLLFFAVVLLLATRHPATRRQAAGAAALFAGFAALGLLFYAPYSLGYAYVLALLTSALLLEHRPASPARRCLSGLWWALIGLMTLPFALEQLACRPLPRDSPAYARLRVAAVAPSVRLLEFDEYALRYVFAYRPPSGAEDWIQCCTGAERLPISLTAKPAGEAWLVGARKLELYVPEAGIHAERVRIFGHTFGTLIRHPGELHWLP